MHVFRRVYVHVSRRMRISVCIDRYAERCLGLRARQLTRVRLAMCMDMCLDMRINSGTDRYVRRCMIAKPDSRSGSTDTGNNVDTDICTNRCAGT